MHAALALALALSRSIFSLQSRLLRRRLVFLLAIFFLLLAIFFLLLAIFFFLLAIFFLLATAWRLGEGSEAAATSDRTRQRGLGPSLTLSLLRLCVRSAAECPALGRRRVGGLRATV